MTNALDQARETEAKLSAELNAYCEQHNLPTMSADELWHECWAVRDGEKSSFIPPATTDERVKELGEAMIWLSDFIERWDAASEITDDLMRGVVRHDMTAALVL